MSVALILKETVSEFSNLISISASSLNFEKGNVPLVSLMQLLLGHFLLLGSAFRLLEMALDDRVSI